MTTEAALLSAIRAFPDDDTPRLVYADWLDEFGADDRARATAEFIRLSCRGAKALPVAAGKWLDNLFASEDGRPNWQRLVPTLAGLIRGDPFSGFWYARKGRWMTLSRIYTRGLAAWQVGAACLEFTRGFLRRVVCRNWQFWDVVGPLLVADQPLLEPELTGGVFTDNEMELIPDTGEYRGTRHPAGGRTQNAVVYRRRVGPCFDALERNSWNIKNLHLSEPYAMWYAGEKNDAAQRARLALAKALVKRAEGIRAGTAKAGADGVGSAAAVELGGESG